MRRIVERATRLAHTDDFSIVEYSILDNHLHLFVEADSKQSLSRGMQGFGIRLAKALNKSWSRKGTVFAQRYFARFLERVGDVRKVLRYVLQNARKHGIPLPAGEPDPYSSALWFPWVERPRRIPADPPMRRPEHLQTITARHAPFSLFEVPGPSALATAILA